MSTAYRPPNWPSVIPRIVTDDVAGLTGFIKTVFGASGDLLQERPTELTIDESKVMISSLGPRSAFPAFLYVYVPNVAAVHERALASGATEIEAPAQMPYGDTRAMFDDPWGNRWQIAQFGQSKR